MQSVRIVSEVSNANATLAIPETGKSVPFSTCAKTRIHVLLTLTARPQLTKKRTKQMPHVHVKQVTKETDITAWILTSAF